MFCEEALGFAKCHRVLDTRLINFAQQSAMQLNDPSLKRYPSFRFPGGLPITVEARHMKRIKSGSYVFTAKADGLRVLVVFIKYYLDSDWQNLCVTLSRDGSCHLLSVEPPSEVYENGGSLFDAELVSTTSGWSKILLFDCYSYQGSNLRELPLSRRFSRCEKLCEASVHHEHHSVIFKIKPYHTLKKENLHDAEAFLNNSNHFLEYNTDGVILVPSGQCTCTHGRDETQFKLKMDHTIDLILIQDTDDEETPHYLASYDDTDDSYVTKQQVTLTGQLEGMPVNTIFECRIVTCDEINTYVPVKPRFDKTHPNSENTLSRTLRTMADNITIAQLMTCY